MSLGRMNFNHGDLSRLHGSHPSIDHEQDFVLRFQIGNVEQMAGLVAEGAPLRGPYRGARAPLDQATARMSFWWTGLRWAADEHGPALVGKMKRSGTRPWNQMDGNWTA